MSWRHEEREGIKRYESLLERKPGRFITGKFSAWYLGHATRRCPKLPSKSFLELQNPQIHTWL